MKYRYQQDEEVFLVKNTQGIRYGLPYIKFNKGEKRRYKIVRWCPWGGHDVRMLTSKGWSKGIYFVREADMFPTKLLEKPLEEYL